MQEINTITPGSITDWIAIVVSIVSFAISVALSLRVFRLNQDVFRLTQAQPTYQCDTQFFEIQKILLSNPDLLDFYKPIMSDFWAKLSQADKKMYIFCETYYFHFAFVYREYKNNRISESYWQLVKIFLIKLKKNSKMFNQVHANERLVFEKEFGEFFDSLLE